jgi:hypothetical protein
MVVWIHLFVLLPLIQTAGAFMLSRRQAKAQRIVRASLVVEVEATPTLSEFQPYLDKVAREDELFRTDQSVLYWRKFQSKGQQENLRIISNFFTSVLPSSNPLQRAVWASFLIRTGFFGTNAALAGLLAERLLASSLPNEMELSFRIVELIQCYDQELKYIEEGRIKYPWDYIVQNPTQSQQVRVQWNHRQSNPLLYLLFRKACVLFAKHIPFLDAGRNFKVDQVEVFLPYEQ